MSELTVEMFSGSTDDARPIMSEALRYMGYRGNTPDESGLFLIESCERELMQAIRPQCCYAYSDIKILTDHVVDFGFGPIESHDLARHLSGCYGVYLFAATIGIGADRLIAKYNRLNPAKSVTIDALGSSSVESWCDNAERRIIEGIPDTCSRFSAGYGDFSLSCQRDFMQCLDMNRKLGITLSDSLLMTPTKSVTAVIGVGASRRSCGNKCSVCGNSTCLYRKK